jgi:hypothetical protein
MPVTHVPVTVGDVTAYTVKADNSGLTHYIPDLTGDCTFTLPAPQAGLRFKFVYTGAAADAQDWIIITGSATNYYKGGGVYFDSDAGDTADEAFPVFSDGNSNDTLTVLTPQGGTWVEVECADGVTWNVNACVVSASATSLAFAD